MSKINDLRDRLLNNQNKSERLKAAEELTKIASEGNDEATEILYEMLKKEADPHVRVKPFEFRLKSKTDRRKRFLYDEESPGELFILPILKKRNITADERSAIIEFAKSVVEVYEADDWTVVVGAMEVLSYLEKDDELFKFVDIWLKRDTTNINDLLSPLEHRPSILQKIILAVRERPDEYSLHFVKIFDWLLRNPLPDTAEMIGKELWLNLPSKYKEAVRLYYYKKIEDLYTHLLHEERILKGGYFSVPTRHPFVEWLEGFERGAVTSSITSYSALQMVAEKIGLHLKDVVRQIETLEPSPITRGQGRKELQEEKNKELIPIDKYLGQYFPDDQLIKLYMTEIHDCARRLGVSAEALRRVVEFHESGHAVVHLGRDADGKNFNTGAFEMVDGSDDPSPLHETLAQLLTYHCVKDVPELFECFEKLDQRQPSAYKKWKNFTDVPLERIRNVLVGIRQGRIEARFDMFAKIVI